MRAGWRVVASVLLAASLCAATTPAPGPGTLRERRLRPAIDLAADYLTRNCDGTGRFRYRLGANSSAAAASDYNILRHAGSIYALGMYEEVRPDARTRRTMLRATRFLKENALRPVDGHPDLIAVWSDEDRPDSEGTPVAKLGGAGLGLVALLGVERVAPGTTPLEVLQGLGRFVLFLQKSDGSFYSKYVPAQGGRDDRWTSLYYPGEAALGLILLYERDGSPVWLRAAAEALAHLARSRKGQAVVPADHWALLASARIVPLWERSGNPLHRNDIVLHAIQIAESMLGEAAAAAAAGPSRGALTAGGRTCPTATRVEGLLAASTLLPEGHAELRGRIESTVDEAIGFLLRAQISSGERAGGLPRALEDRSARAAEVRIDYVQHALCAWIQYSRTGSDASDRWN